MNAATKTRHIGSCQICEADHKLTSHALNGVGGSDLKMVHHGYHRPGWGEIVGDCAGVGEAPYEVSCEAAKAYLERLRTAAAAVEFRLADLRAGKVVELMVQPRRAGGLWRTCTPADADWPAQVRDAIHAGEHRLRGLNQEIARMVARVEEWTRRPLRTVEEVEGPKATEREVAKAARQAAYLARTEAKIASYRKRLAAACKNRTQSTIADIFDSAPRQLGDRGMTTSDVFFALGTHHFEAFGLDLAGGTHHSSANGAILSRMHGFGAPIPWPADLT